MLCYNYLNISIVIFSFLFHIYQLSHLPFCNCSPEQNNPWCIANLDGFISIFYIICPSLCPPVSTSQKLSAVIGKQSIPRTVCHPAAGTSALFALSGRHASCLSLSSCAIAFRSFPETVSATLLPLARNTIYRNTFLWLPDPCC